MAKYIYEAIRDPSKTVIGKNKFKVVYEDRNFIYFKRSPDATLESIRRDYVAENLNASNRYFWENFYLSENKPLLENRNAREYIKKLQKDMHYWSNQIGQLNKQLELAEDTIAKVKKDIHPSVMIIGGNGLDKAFSDLHIHASCLYHSKKYPDYEVWELLPEDFEKIDFIKDEDWKQEWGWWRTGHCTLEGATENLIMVNGKPMYSYLPLTPKENLKDNYIDFFEYLYKVFDLSTSYNRAYFATSLAKDNGMTLDEFMRTFQP